MRTRYRGRHDTYEDRDMKTGYIEKHIHEERIHRRTET